MSNKNKLPDMLTKEQMVKLFENILIPKCSIGCFMALMCGLRINEICNLQTADIDLQKRKLKIRDSKNPNRTKQGYGKDRYIPIPECAVSPIRKWLSIIEGGKWFMPSEKSPDLPLRKKTLHVWFGEARRRAGLDIVDYFIKYKKRTNNKEGVNMYKYRFHHLRHFYATYVYEKSRDLYAVSNLLGHNQVSTTQIYAKISDKLKQDTIDFAFNMPIRTKMFEKNPVNAVNYAIPEIAKEKNPVQILEERFARGEISASDFQTALRLLKVKKDYFENDKTKNTTIDIGRETETN
jgi:integrase